MEKGKGIFFSPCIFSIMQFHSKFLAQITLNVQVFQNQICEAVGRRREWDEVDAKDRGKVWREQIAWKIDRGRNKFKHLLMIIDRPIIIPINQYKIRRSINSAIHPSKSKIRLQSGSPKFFFSLPLAIKFFKGKKKYRSSPYFSN